MISNRQLYHEDREEELENETIEDIQERISHSLDQMREHIEYFNTGIQTICEDYKTKQDGEDR